jgi:hypothetical protein
VSTFVPEPQHEQIRRSRYPDDAWRKAVALIGPWLLSLVIGLAIARLAFGIFTFFQQWQVFGAVIGTALLIILPPLLAGWRSHRGRDRIESAFGDDPDGKQD